MICPARLLLTACCLALLTPPAPARDDRAGEVKKEKDAVAARLTKAGLPTLAPVETDDLLVYAAVPDAKARPLADGVQKTYQLARTALKFEPAETLWPGKLSVIVITDPAQFTAFVRQVEQRRPEKGVFTSMDLRGDVPYVIDSVEVGERATDAEIRADAAAAVASAVLSKKAGTGASLPDWLLGGFGRMIAARAEGPAKLTTFHTKTKSAVLGTRSRPVLVRAADVWGGQKGKDGDLVAASFVEFLVFGPEADKFPKILSALKPSDTQPMPTMAAALADLEWRPEVLDLAWKQWVSKQK